MKKTERKEAERKGVQLGKNVSGLAFKAGDAVNPEGQAHDQKHPAGIGIWFEKKNDNT